MGNNFASQYSKPFEFCKSIRLISFVLSCRLGAQKKLLQAAVLKCGLVQVSDLQEWGRKIYATADVMVDDLDENSEWHVHDMSETALAKFADLILNETWVPEADDDQSAEPLEYVKHIWQVFEQSEWRTLPSCLAFAVEREVEKYKARLAVLNRKMTHTSTMLSELPNVTAAFKTAFEKFQSNTKRVLVFWTKFDQEVGRDFYAKLRQREGAVVKGNLKQKSLYKLDVATPSLEGMPLRLIRFSGVDIEPARQSLSQLPSASDNSRLRQCLNAYLLAPSAERDDNDEVRIADENEIDPGTDEDDATDEEDQGQDLPPVDMVELFYIAPENEGMESGDENKEEGSPGNEKENSDGETWGEWGEEGWYNDEWGGEEWGENWDWSGAGEGGREANEGWPADQARALPTQALDLYGDRIPGFSCRF